MTDIGQTLSGFGYSSLGLVSLFVLFVCQVLCCASNVRPSYKYRIAASVHALYGPGSRRTALSGSVPPHREGSLRMAPHDPPMKSNVSRIVWQN